MLSGPVDVVEDSKGVVFIANRNTQEVLRVSTGGGVTLLALLGGRPQYLSIDSQDRVYVSRDNRVDRIWANGLIEAFWTGVGASTTGLMMRPPSTQRGFAFLLNPANGQTLTIDQGLAGEMSFVLQFSGSCGSSAQRTCVPAAPGTAASAMASAINQVAGAPGSSLRVVATHTSGPLVSLESKVAGEPAGTAAVRLATSSQFSLLISGNTLGEGHDEEVYAGQDQDNNVYRFTLTGNPFNGTSFHHGAYNNADRQRGIAVRDIWKGPTDSLFDYLVYFIPRNQPNEVWARQFRGNDSRTQNSAASLRIQINSQTSGAGFGNLRDLALSPDGGCLLATDLDRNIVYAINVSKATNAPSIVAPVADGFSRLQGVTFDRQGNALFADHDANVVYRLAPLASPAPGCF
jgi:hypothetical protein